MDIKIEDSNNIYQVILSPKDISTEFLFEKEDWKDQSGKRFYSGDEFHGTTKRHTSEPSLSVGGGNSNLNKAGKNIIIDEDIYNNSGQNVALAKNDFANAVYEGKINISRESWGNFRPIFARIEKILGGNDVLE